MMRIIPAIDIIGGKCVRLVQGDYAQKKVYNENPVEVAREFEDNGIQYLHLVDLDGAKSQGIVNWRVLEAIATKTKLTIDFGGGIKSDEDIKIAFDSGASQVTGGSIAVKNKNLFADWLQQYGSEKIILGADVKDRKIAVNGWQEGTDIELFPFIEEYLEKGIQHLICTDISKDGLLQGTSLDLYKDILERFDTVKLIASGGVTSISELEALKKLGVNGAIIGKAIYENRISLKDLRNYVD